MEAMTVDAVLAQIRMVPGVLSVDLKYNRLWIRVAARDWFPVDRRVAAWLSLCVLPMRLRWELEKAEPCGAYDSMERAISTMGYRPAGASGFPPKQPLSLAAGKVTQNLIGPETPKEGRSTLGVKTEWNRRNALADSA
ncbi:MAG TPA: hypothetical protein VLZ30_07680 [Verrucomicrobiae bacterium]|nr:hypothetical protein [Verrucomicrobiae bacterium]